MERGEGIVRKVKVDEVVSPGFKSRVIGGTVCAVYNLDELEELVRNPPGSILALPHLYWDDWFLNVGFLAQFDAVLVETRTSVLCHAAILMREIGFVCITVSDLFDQIKDGDRVRITIERSGLRRAIKDLLYNLRWKKHLFRYPRGAGAWVCELVVFDRPLGE